MYFVLLSNLLRWRYTEKSQWHITITRGRLLPFPCFLFAMQKLKSEIPNLFKTVFPLHRFLPKDCRIVCNPPPIPADDLFRLVVLPRQICRITHMLSLFGNYLPLPLSFCIVLFRLNYRFILGFTVGIFFRYHHYPLSYLPDFPVLLRMFQYCLQLFITVFKSPHSGHHNACFRSVL